MATSDNIRWDLVGSPLQKNLYGCFWSTAIDFKVSFLSLDLFITVYLRFKMTVVRESVELQ